MRQLSAFSSLALVGLMSAACSSSEPAGGDELGSGGDGTPGAFPGQGATDGTSGDGPGGLFWEDENPAFGSAGPTGECRVDELVGPGVYGNKVKSLITGLPLSDEELQQLEADPDSLGGLIEDWMELPEAEAVFTRFFMSAFQQTELDISTFYYPTTHEALPTSGFEGVGTSAQTWDLGNHNFSEMFARTAWYFVENDEPWTNILTTNRFMMTPAIMNWIAFKDDNVSADDGTTTSRTSDELDQSLRFMIDQANEPPASETLDRNHENFMLFYHDNLREEFELGCGDVPPIVEVAEDGESALTPDWFHYVGGRRRDHQFSVFSMMWGRRYFVQNADCRGFRGGRPPLLEFSDFTDWKMVDVRQPEGEEEPTRFYDMATLRSSNELVLESEQVGFMSSPGFQATWLTNEDNSSRVTINQILIVALGASFEGAAVSDFTPEGLDTEHAAPGTECYGCHQTLDPMRDFVRNSLTNFYGPQEDPERRDAPSEFVFGGVHATGNGLGDLANILAEHPYFPRGWVQKLCFYANAQACEEGEEFERVVAAFVESGHNFKTLVRELFSSPMVTGRSCEGGRLAGPVIARRSQFCQRLSRRLNVEDICGLRLMPGAATADQRRVGTAVESVPDDAFSRAVVEPVTISETSLFIRANREVACTHIAQQAFDDSYRDLPREEVVALLVEDVMALPSSHALHAGARAVIEGHLEAVIAEGQSERTARQSAFIVACMSPGSAGVGF